MPKIEVEIQRTVTVTREESATIELDVPQHILDGDLHDWFERRNGVATSAVHRAVAEVEWEVHDEDETIEYDSVTDLS